MEMARNFLLWNLLVFIIFTLGSGCGQGTATSGSSLSVANGSRAKKDQFPAAVRIYAFDTSCSGSKVGPQHFLLAAHCTINEQGDLLNHFQPGARIGIQHGETAKSITNYRLKVVATYVHPAALSYAKAFAINVNNENHKHLFPDVAVVVVDRPTPNIKTAKIQADMSDSFLSKLKEKESIVFAGWGLKRNPKWKDQTNSFSIDDPIEAKKPSLKPNNESGRAFNLFDILVPMLPARPSYYTRSFDQLNFIYGNVTDVSGLFMDYNPQDNREDAKNKPNNYDLPGIASGDSGGGAYLNDGENLTIVGVNSVAGMFPSGIHSSIIRVDNGGPSKVGDWIEEALDKPIESQKIKYSFQSECNVLGKRNIKGVKDRVIFFLEQLKFNVVSGVITASSRSAKVNYSIVSNSNKLELSFDLEKESMITKGFSFSGKQTKDGRIYKLLVTFTRRNEIERMIISLFHASEKTPNKFLMETTMIAPVMSACYFESTSE